ncbi:DUF4365 domain-containing protein (plasmid) [Sphingomonas panni]|uniref:DUF4365 domain-containing protein n=1 Tax=Sphingomonas panni TaxID=237612 RepID=UPI0037046956
MPVRARSHELEELSVARFNDLLPAKWVSRSKRPDYGIDREVEIFNDEGQSTGLCFLVQLRATDDVARANKVPLKVNELRYYRQHELPVMVVRYYSGTNSFFWQWESLISFRAKLREGQKTTIYTFDESECWGDETTADIWRTLEVRRALANFPQGAAVPVRFDFSGLPATKQYPMERALGEAISQCAGALTRTKEQRAVEIEIAPTADSISVRIDTITSIKIDLPGGSPNALATSALYGAIRLFAYKGLHRQAERIARAVLDHQRPHHEGKLGLVACQALAGDPIAAVDLAILHGLHREPIEYGAVMFDINRSPAPKAARAAATDRFSEAALAAAYEVDAASAAAVHYSFANYLRDYGPASRALNHLNQARRLRPAYLRTGYFLREVGGILFLAGHPRYAADAYRAARGVDDDPLLALLLGDALMMSGALAEAEIEFEFAANSLESGPQVQEAELKRITCAWLSDLTGSKHVSVDRASADTAMHADSCDGAMRLLEIIRTIDALNPRAHFNLGVLRSREGERSDAIWHFLTCAFVQTADVAAWANAAICAFGPDDRVFIAAILSVAIHVAGADVYERLRASLVEQGAPAESIASFDMAAIELIESAQATHPREFTFRLLNGESFEEMTVIDP